ncbi:hypothetical protein FQN50_009826 [Emmonsiellopsis sp. PD_5]|nr:hypothetical protein FQN50_009826 [Emmonsiellopsis sp. PD_5]
MGTQIVSLSTETKNPLGITVLKFILHQWLLFCFGLVCLLAYFFPEVAKHGGIIKAEYSILYGAVAVIFLISGLSIPRDKLVTHMLNYRLHLQVQGISFLLIPALICAIVRLIDATDPNGKIDKAVLAGYILLACLPTTIASNVVMTRAAGGDEAAALVEVFIANMSGPFITPGWAVALLPKSQAYDIWRESNGDLGTMYASVFRGLGLSVLLPLVLGQFIRFMWAERTAWVLQKLYLGKVATAALVFLVWSGFSTCFATHALDTLTPQTIALTVLLNVFLYLFLTGVSFIIAYPPSSLLATPDPHPPTLPKSKTQKTKSLLHTIHKHTIKQTPPRETIAICFCGPAKTTGLGLPLLYAMYPNVDLQPLAKLSVPVILYTTEQIFCAHFMVYLFRWWMGRVEGEGEEGEDGKKRQVRSGDEGEDGDVEKGDGEGSERTSGNRSASARVSGVTDEETVMGPEGVEAVEADDGIIGKEEKMIERNG